MKTALLRSMTELTSRKWLSQLTGCFAKSRLSRAFIPTFARTYRIPLDEAEKPLHEYKTLNEFFTRRLVAGARTIDRSEGVVVSPVDAVITGIGPITDDGTMLAVKGQDYTVREMLNDDERIATYAGGSYLVLYLSPQDYHRIHAPISGQIIKREHIPGKVYPVNEFGLRQMKRVLSRNERLNTFIRVSDGDAPSDIAVVKVAALNVSSIKYVAGMESAKTIAKGEELAYFEFGSTVVLLFPKDIFTCDEAIQLGTKVRMGQRLGTL